MERKAAEDKRKPARSGQAMEVYEDDWEEMQPIQRTTGTFFYHLPTGTNSPVKIPI